MKKFLAAMKKKKIYNFDLHQDVIGSVQRVTSVTDIDNGPTKQNDVIDFVFDGIEVQDEVLLVLTMSMRDAKVLAKRM